MLPVLDDLIGRFRKAQDIAVHTLVHKLSIPQPDSNRAWAFYCVEKGLHQARELKGVGVYAHGYGIELKIENLTIDFDWGDHGEPDGFDGWRLWNFRTDNCSQVGCTHTDVISWLEDSHNDGELIKQGSLYYDPKRRAS